MICSKCRYEYDDSLPECPRCFAKDRKRTQLYAGLGIALSTVSLLAPAELALMRAEKDEGSIVGIGIAIVGIIFSIGAIWNMRKFQWPPPGRNHTILFTSAIIGIVLGAISICLFTVLLIT